MLNIKWTCCVLELHSMYANAPICFFSSSPWQFQNSEEKNKVRNLQIGYTLNLCVLFQDTLFMGVPMTPCKVVVSWKRKGEYLFPIHTQMGQASEKGYILCCPLLDDKFHKNTRLFVWQLNWRWEIRHIGYAMSSHVLIPSWLWFTDLFPLPFVSPYGCKEKVDKEKKIWNLFRNWGNPK